MTDFALFQLSVLARGNDMKKTILALTIVLIPMLSWGKTPWPKSAKVAYVERCTSTMLSRGIPQKYAKSCCDCIANGMEREFGLEDYALMMKAKPDPAGSSSDKKFYRVFRSCAEILPK